MHLKYLPQPREFQGQEISSFHFSTELTLGMMKYIRYICFDIRYIWYLTPCPACHLPPDTRCAFLSCPYQIVSSQLQRKLLQFHHQKHMVSLKKRESSLCIRCVTLHEYIVFICIIDTAQLLKIKSCKKATPCFSCCRRKQAFFCLQYFWMQKSCSEI